ncbi:conserved hypothetical protein [Talaromyces stipitatus ATCC 10500]|uniref:MYB DNA-binding domain protein n=1 Tax=Talaromyces stipitatus (strain ATCC 10500 / CBS 375.48 / QM 6759 / NRRL 1006) TaxID=441959 RepID=B8MPQ0_TALSN|nr:uncharacterized protein TSTA_106970 [Talaromyces stipitatus ATCC 10500]EED14489.1 conserved hypothetical protein [Talaromyces stipitatus ATCC 10500]
MTAGNTKLSAQSLEESAKKSKWSPEEDALVIDLRGKQMKWDEISKRLPGRSPISCRLHYQNYLERPEWDENKKNKLARMYERLKANMWAEIAQEMNVPWRAAEAMHWELGEQEMARRAGPIALRAKRNMTLRSKPRHHSLKINHCVSLSPSPRTTILHPPPQSSIRHPNPAQGQLRLPSIEELIAGVPLYGPSKPYIQ